MRIRSLTGLGSDVPDTVIQSFAEKNACVVFPAKDADELIRQCTEGISRDAIVLDSAIPNSKTLVETLRRDFPETTVVVVQKPGAPSGISEHDVFAVIPPPISVEMLAALFDIAAKQRDLINETAFYRAQEANYFDELVGRSEWISRVFRDVINLARENGHVLLSGDCGVGKSLLARNLHRSSAQVCKPLISANCFQLPGSLLERKLFDCRETSVGGLRAPFGKLWDIAAGGTLYLERAECMSPEFQARLNTIMAEQQAADPGKISARRVILSSRLNGEKLQGSGFNRELLARFQPVHIPALTERREDIPLLSEYYLKQFNQRYGLDVALETQARETLFNYNWPGNIRELKVCIERAVFAAQNGVMNDESLRFHPHSPEKSSATPARPATVPTPPSPPALVAAPAVTVPEPQSTAAAPAQIIFNVGQSLEEIEAEMIQKTMEQTGFNRTHTAKMLDISVRTLYTKLLDIEQRAKLASSSEKK
ncbi:MAG: sigma 54-interacting transcriptional regulator [Planctomycetota bacterium]